MSETVSNYLNGISHLPLYGLCTWIAAVFLFRYFHKKLDNEISGLQVEVLVMLAEHAPSSEGDGGND